VLRGYAPPRFFVGWRILLRARAWGCAAPRLAHRQPASAPLVVGAYTRLSLSRRRSASPLQDALASIGAFSFFLKKMEPFFSSATVFHFSKEKQ
jgi:hypothetical protein